MRILVLADIGQAVYHVGDEAMGIAAGDALRARGFEVAYATRGAEHTRAFIDTDAQTMATLKFPWAPADRERLLVELREFLAHGNGRAEIRDFVQALSGFDGILIAGGGNMNSRYGWLLYERAAYGLVAQHLEIPLIISGQTFGPVLTSHDAEVLDELLDSALAVSAREPGSVAYARGRGQAVRAGIDDASFYTAGSRSLTGAPVAELPERYLCVTLNQLDDAQVTLMARLLDRVYDAHQLTTVFLPHMGTPGAEDADAALHASVTAAMHHEALQLPILHTDQAVAVHRGAVAGFSSRYHPAVFSLSSAVPFVALLPDAFTNQRVQGAMTHFGADDYALPLALLSEGGFDTIWNALDEVLRHRDALHRQLTDRVTELEGYSQSYWDTVAEALHGSEVALLEVSSAQKLSAPEGTTGSPLPLPEVNTRQVNLPWRTTAHVLRDQLANLSLAAHRAEAELDRALSWDVVHRAERDDAQRQLADELTGNNSGQARISKLGIKLGNRLKSGRPAATLGKAITRLRHKA